MNEREDQHKMVMETLVLHGREISEDITITKWCDAHEREGKRIDVDCLVVISAVLEELSVLGKMLGVKLFVSRFHFIGGEIFLLNTSLTKCVESFGNYLVSSEVSAIYLEAGRGAPEGWKASHISNFSIVNYMLRQVVSSRFTLILDRVSPALLISGLTCLRKQTDELIIEFVAGEIWCVSSHITVSQHLDREKMQKTNKWGLRGQWASELEEVLTDPVGCRYRLVFRGRPSTILWDAATSSPMLMSVKVIVANISDADWQPEVQRIWNYSFHMEVGGAVPERSLCGMLERSFVCGAGQQIHLARLQVPRFVAPARSYLTRLSLPLHGSVVDSLVGLLLSTTSILERLDLKYVSDPTLQQVNQLKGALKIASGKSLMHLVFCSDQINPSSTVDLLRCFMKWEHSLERIELIGFPLHLTVPSDWKNMLGWRQALEITFRHEMDWPPIVTPLWVVHRNRVDTSLAGLKDGGDTKAKSIAILHDTVTFLCREQVHVWLRNTILYHMLCSKSSGAWREG